LAAGRFCKGEDMAMQILRYGALALVSACLVMIALVIGGLVPLETVRGVMEKVPALVQVTPEKPVKVTKAEDVTVKEASTEVEKTEANEAVAKPDPNAAQVPDSDDTSKAVSGKADKDVSKNETEAASNDTPVPAFDVLRVEKDGSTVVAGRAAPNSTIELRAGDGLLIGSGRAGTSGDFVIIPDNPLPKGDYSLSLVAIDEDGNETVSAETATVSIPDGDSRDVLAMISKPGEASRIIAKPETLKVDEGEADETKTADGSGDAADTTEETAGTAQLVEGEDAPKGDIADTKLETSQQERETASSETGADNAKQEATDAKREQQTAALNPQTGAGEQAKTSEEVRQDNETVDKETVDKEGASVSLPTSGSAPTGTVRVEAVEIERDQIFVAGAATRGSIVRIYIDDELVGEARGTPDDRFLVTKRYKLKRGPHVVRADSIDNATGKVIARAEVPLLHEPVEDVAAADDADDKTNDAVETPVEGMAADSKADETEIAMAKPEDETEFENGSRSSAAKTSNDRAAINPEDTLKADTQQANPVTTTGDNAGKKPETSKTAGTEVSKKPSDTQSDNTTGQQVAVAKPEKASPQSDDGQNTVNQTGPAKETAPTSDEPKSEPGEDTKAANIVTKDAVDITDKTPAKTLKPADKEVVKTPEVPPEDAVVEEPREVTATEPAPEIEGAPDGTIRTGTSVIIKSGDNLWRISRKTYGRGIRYTTIYEANRDQIRNPHRIYIGQIFKIPDRPDEELVEADG